MASALNSALLASKFVIKSVRANLICPGKQITTTVPLESAMHSFGPKKTRLSNDCCLKISSRQHTRLRQCISTHTVHHKSLRRSISCARIPTNRLPPKTCSSAQIPSNNFGAINRTAASKCSPPPPPCPCPCPCPCPPPSLGCLPPPSHCPPKCIQYMTGYFYYPYGWWYCGPYHQETCAPGGPVTPGKNPCPPCPPSPPCPPKCPCPKCCIVPELPLSKIDPTLQPIIDTQTLYHPATSSDQKKAHPKHKKHGESRNRIHGFPNTVDVRKASPFLKKPNCFVKPSAPQTRNNSTSAHEPPFLRKPNCFVKPSTPRARSNSMSAHEPVIFQDDVSFFYELGRDFASTRKHADVNRKNW